MNDADGLAFLLCFAGFGVVALLVALAVERIQRRELREYIKRERARAAWKARVVGGQQYWKD